MTDRLKPPILPDDWDDNPEWTEEDFARARPASEVMGPEFAAKLMRRDLRPKTEDSKD
jgi:uncharacterized protein (DUF4415 family)